jgi:hypothetical protein
MNDNLWVETTVSFKAPCSSSAYSNWNPLPRPFSRYTAFQQRYNGLPLFVTFKKGAAGKHFQLFLRKTGLLLNATQHYECTAGNIIRSWMLWRTTIRVKTLNQQYPLKHNTMTPRLWVNTIQNTGRSCRLQSVTHCTFHISHIICKIWSGAAYVVHGWLESNAVLRQSTLRRVGSGSFLNVGIKRRRVVTFKHLR